MTPWDDPMADPMVQRLIRADPTLSTAERKVARFIMDNRATALAASAAEVAATAGTSDATVIRAARALGFSGWTALRQELARSLDLASTPADKLRRTIAASKEDVAASIALALNASRTALDELLPQAPALRRGVEALFPVERIVLFGLGPTAAIARYAAALLGRNGRRAKVLDARGRAMADQLLDLAAGDGMLMLAYGKPYREANVVLREASRLALPVVLITDGAIGALAARAGVVVPVRRSETPHVASHGATLAALEAIILGLAVADPLISTAALDRLAVLRDDLDPND